MSTRFCLGHGICFKFLTLSTGNFSLPHTYGRPLFASPTQLLGLSVGIRLVLPRTSTSSPSRSSTATDLAPPLQLSQDSIGSKPIAQIAAAAVSSTCLLVEARILPWTTPSTRPFHLAFPSSSPLVTTTPMLATILLPGQLMPLPSDLPQTPMLDLRFQTMAPAWISSLQEVKSSLLGLRVTAAEHIYRAPAWPVLTLLALLLFFLAITPALHLMRSQT